MNGGTSLRAEGAINRLAASNIVARALLLRRAPAPLSPHFCGQFARQTLAIRRDRNRVDRPRAHH
jgi:hypothetical protein